MQRPIRVINCDTLRYKYYSITQSETRLTVRILVPVLSPYNSEVPEQELYTTNSLRGNIVCINEIYYMIAAEGIFDIDNELHRYWWTAGSNIMFYCTPTSVSMGIVEVCQKGGLTMGTKENSAELGHRLGHTTFCQIWCRNPNDKITETAKSIVFPTDGLLVTNIPMDNPYVTTPDQVNVRGSSTYLNMEFQLIGPQKVVPNQMFECELRVLCDVDQHLATDACGTFVVEAVDGYVPHKRVEVVNGIGKFKACSLMLQSGEQMRIKVGTKTYSSRAELIIPVE